MSLGSTHTHSLKCFNGFLLGSDINSETFSDWSDFPQVHQEKINVIQEWGGLFCVIMSSWIWGVQAWWFQVLSSLSSEAWGRRFHTRLTALLSSRFLMWDIVVNSATHSHISSTAIFISLADVQFRSLTGLESDAVWSCSDLKVYIGWKNQWKLIFLVKCL
jgi:hypothetical protein